MMATAESVKGQLATRTDGEKKDIERSPQQTIAQYLKSMQGQIAEVLPKHITPERLTRVAMSVIRTTPKLLECDLPSLLAAVFQAASLGLEPGLLGHCYIIPYGKKATFIIGYKGMIDLARRSGDIQSINAHEVYEHDLLEVEYGLEENLRHIPWHLRSDKTFDKAGLIRGFYMVAKFKDGGHYIHYMSKQEVDDHRKRSKSGHDGPWVTDYVEMGKKTVVRSGWKWLPISIEIAEKVTVSDESTRDDIMTAADAVIDISYDTVGSNDEQNTEKTSDSQA